MRYLVLICSMFIGTLAYSQDTICIPSSEVEQFFLALDKMRSQDSLKNTIISTYEDMLHTDSMLLVTKDNEIEALNIKLDLYEERLDHLDKWYRTPWFGVGTGVLGTILLNRALN